MEKVEYWFNTATGEVEVGKQSLSVDRLGPFETFDEAKNAMDTIARRAAALRAEDADDDWN